MFTNFHLLGRAAEPAAYEMSKQRLQQHTGVDMNLFMVKRAHPRKGPASLLCLPREQTFMKTFPQNHYNSITIPSSHYLRHDCICCSANPPPNQPTHPPTHHTTIPVSYILRMQPSKVKESAVSAFPLGCVERRLAAARFTPVLNSQSASIHLPLWGGTAD